jgi:hypothetical protein
MRTRLLHRQPRRRERYQRQLRGAPLLPMGDLGTPPGETTAHRAKVRNRRAMAMSKLRLVVLAAGAVGLLAWLGVRGARWLDQEADTQQGRRTQRWRRPNIIGLSPEVWPGY